MNKPHFHYLPPQQPFLETLARLLLQRYADAPLGLARLLLLLPSRRSCRSMQEMFLRMTEGKPLLLPRIVPIGDMEGETELAMFAPASAQPMAEKRRIALLARLILQQKELSPARACQLAGELAHLLDEVIKYDLGFEQLQALAPLELAAHWQQTTEFLSLITRHWPRILAAEEKEDAALLHRQQMQQLAAVWRENPPDFPVIAAGSTGSHPATAALLHSIAQMPHGMVILPGLDGAMSPEAWDNLDPTHPQYGLKQLLAQSKTPLAEVRPLVPEASAPNHALATLFSPAALTAHWREMPLDLPKELGHISLLQADSQHDEARMIAYTLRETLETEGKTAALITTDRHLARMVAAQCARWKIVIDDSAGETIAHAPAAVFLRLLLEAVSSGFAPLPLLALLQHPFAALGQESARTREFCRQLEAGFLREVRLESGMDALRAELRTHGAAAELAAWLERLGVMVRPLEMLFVQQSPCAISALLDAHSEVAIALASRSDQNGNAILWKGSDGEALANLLAEWRQHADALGAIMPQDYPALFESWLTQTVTRQNFGTHPRLQILSPIEARLLHFDRVILGEMNEGTWPAPMRVDPWMSAPMREAFGLPPHALHIGQSAHDVWMFLHAPEVVMTRSRKIGGSPKEPSRWWARFASLVGGKDPALLAKMDVSHAMEELLRVQDAPEALPALQMPVPVPPASARPRRFSPSSLQLWQDAPYAFYARYILRLQPLNPLDQEPDMRDFGEMMHRALEHFTADFPEALPPHAYQQLLHYGRMVFQPYLQRPAIAMLWWPRFEAIARQWLERETLLRAQARYHTDAELSVTWKFTVGQEAIQLNARADRVDYLAEGFRLIDYKTGGAPSKNQILNAEAMQLPLTALALMHGRQGKARPVSLAYWPMKNSDTVKPLEEITDVTSLLEETEQRLYQIIEESLTQATDYAPEASPTRPNSQDAYHHLSRRAEWSSL